MYPLKSSVEGPPAFPQESNLSNSLYTQDEAIQDFLNLPSDMESFMALGSIEEVTMKEEGSSVLPDILKDVGIPQEMEQQVKEEDYSLESNQSLIDEVESYLQFVSGTPTTVDQDDSSTFESNWSLGDITETDQTIMNNNSSSSSSVSADKIFDALTSGNVIQDGIDLNESDLQNAFTTSVVGKNGENVIIIIAAPPPPPSSPVSSAMSPAPSVYTLSPRPAASPAGSTGSGSDYEWTPSPQSVSTIGKARKKYQRKTPTVPPTGPYPKEKKERKKAQNRSAAYKYREKKKAEQEAVDDELTQLEERNVVLNKRMSDLEIELKCLKKLVAEVGLSAYL